MYVTTRIQERMGVWSVCGSIHDYIPIPGGIVSLEGGNFLPGSQFCRYSLSSLRTINITHTLHSFRSLRTWAVFSRSAEFGESVLRVRESGKRFPGIFFVSVPKPFDEIQLFLASFDGVENGFDLV